MLVAGDNADSRWPVKAVDHLAALIAGPSVGGRALVEHEAKPGDRMPVREVTAIQRPCRWSPR